MLLRIFPFLSFRLAVNPRYCNQALHFEWTENISSIESASNRTGSRFCFHHGSLPSVRRGARGAATQTFGLGPLIDEVIILRFQADHRWERPLEVSKAPPHYYHSIYRWGLLNSSAHAIWLTNRSRDMTWLLLFKHSWTGSHKIAQNLVDQLLRIDPGRSSYCRAFLLSALYVWTRKFKTPILFVFSLENSGLITWRRKNSKPSIFWTTTVLKDTLERFVFPKQHVVTNHDRWRQNP